jgi:hypothetical protein
MAVQSNKAIGTTSSSSITCTFLSAVHVGDAIAVFVDAGSFTTVAPATCSDGVNTYTQSAYYNGGTGGAPSVWCFTAIAATTAVLSITVTFANTSVYIVPSMMIVEGPPSSGVRVAGQNSVSFGTLTASVSLAGTVSGDYCAMYTVTGSGGTGAPIAGNIGTNTAVAQQSYTTAPNASLMEDGTSSGGAITTTATVPNNGYFEWFAAAVAFIPATTSPSRDPIFFSTNS